MEHNGITSVVYNDCGQYIVILRGTRDISITSYIDNKSCIFSRSQDLTGNNCSVFVLDNCKYNKNITLNLNGDSITVDVDEFPSFPGETILTTMVLTEDDYILPWINHHKKLGVTRFIIYDNSFGTSDLKNVVHAKLELGEVLVIPWNHKWGDGSQQCQNSHAVHTFKKSKWVGLFDIDEYINPQTDIICIDDILQHALTNLELTYDDIGGFNFSCRNFVNKDRLCESDFHKVFHAMDFDRRRCKMFVNPNNVEVFTTHIISAGKRTIEIPVEMVYFNHYIFLNKTTMQTDHYYKYSEGRGFNEYTICIDTSISRFFAAHT